MNAVTDRFPSQAGASLLRLRLVRARDIGTDVRLFTLQSADGAALPQGTPGAHIRLHLPQGMERSYSLCNTPAETGCYHIAVKREADSRGGSAWLHAQFQPGDELMASAPANAFALRDSAQAPALFAAGIGVTPLYAMAAALAGQGQPLHFHYFARSLGHAAFAAELDALGCGMSLHLGLDAAASTRAIGAALQSLDKSTPLYLCGPHLFIEAVRGAARALGWREADVHFELFAAPAAAATAIAPEKTHQHSFELVLQRSGVHCTVHAGQSIVAAAAAVGVNIGTSCGEGFCGSCESTVLDGTPEHRDSVLTERERADGRSIMPCVSRCAGSRLVLDL